MRGRKECFFFHESDEKSSGLDLAAARRDTSGSIINAGINTRIGINVNNNINVNINTNDNIIFNINIIIGIHMIMNINASFGPGRARKYYY